MSDLDRLFNELFSTSIGYDRLSSQLRKNQSFPPYNIVKLENSDDVYVISLAVAGYSRDDIDVELQDGVLTVTGKSDTSDKLSENLVYLHQGIAQRKFKQRFNLDEYIEVEGAMMEDGLLHIKLRRHLPEEKQARKIAINHGVDSKLLLE